MVDDNVFWWFLFHGVTLGIGTGNMNSYCFVDYEAAAARFFGRRGWRSYEERCHHK